MKKYISSNIRDWRYLLIQVSFFRAVIEKVFLLYCDFMIFPSIVSLNIVLSGWNFSIVFLSFFILFSEFYSQSIKIVT